MKPGWYWSWSWNANFRSEQGDIKQIVTLITHHRHTSSYILNPSHPSQTHILLHPQPLTPITDTHLNPSHPSQTHILLHPQPLTPITDTHPLTSSTPHTHHRHTPQPLTPITDTHPLTTSTPHTHHRHTPQPLTHTSHPPSVSSRSVSLTFLMLIFSLSLYSPTPPLLLVLQQIARPSSKNTWRSVF